MWLNASCTIEFNKFNNPYLKLLIVDKKQKLKNELTELTKSADGRSKQVKDAKKNVKKNDQTIADLEAALAEAEKNL